MQMYKFYPHTTLFRCFTRLSVPFLKGVVLNERQQKKSTKITAGQLIEKAPGFIENTLLRSNMHKRAEIFTGIHPPIKYHVKQAFPFHMENACIFCCFVESESGTIFSAAQTFPVRLPDFLNNDYIYEFKIRTCSSVNPSFSSCTL